MRKHIKWKILLVGILFLLVGCGGGDNSSSSDSSSKDNSKTTTQDTHKKSDSKAGDTDTQTNSKAGDTDTQGNTDSKSDSSKAGSTDTQTNGTHSNTQTNSNGNASQNKQQPTKATKLTPAKEVTRYVVKGLFEAQKDACTIQGQKVANSKLVNTEVKKADINDKGQMMLTNGVPSGDFYYITCKGYYEDEVTLSRSTDEIALTGFFNKTVGIHNINVFTDMIAEPVRAQLAKELAAKTTPPPNKSLLKSIA